MARIEPFKGLRPTKELVESVASPPYDVLNSEEARQLAAGNEYSFLHIIKPEIDLPENTDHYSDEVYEKAGENFRKFIQQKILVQDSKPMFYVYKQIWGEHIQVGLVAGASAQEYQDGIIKKHELTREDKEKDRMRHVRTLNANTGPVFLTYRQNDSVDRLLERAMNKEPDYDFESNDVRHIFYVMDDDELIQLVQEEFARIDFLYVADGHHRSASGTNVKIEKEQANPNHTGDEEYNFFLTVIFPHNQMKILAYNRVVKDLQSMCKAEFFHRLSEYFDWQETTLKVPEKNLQFGMYLDGKWFLLTAKEGSFEPNNAVESLDASILQNNLLDPILGIKNPRKDERIHFVGGIRGTKELESLVDSGSHKVAFSLYPTSIDQLFDVADSGKIMPPKSTWFEPKLKSGLIVHLLD